MQRCWIHRELRVTPLQVSSGCSVYEVRGQAWRVVMGLFYTTSVIALSLATFALLHLATRSHGMRAIESFASDLLPRAISPRQLILELTAEQEQAFHSDIRFLARIIEGKTNRVSAYHVARAIVIASRRENFDPLLAAAIISSESTFNPRAQSNRGALGLMQVRPATGEYIAARHQREWRGSSDLIDPVYNIELGISYFRYLERKFKGNRELALIAYNWGPTNLISALQGNTPIPSGPKKYAETILSTHSKWSTLYRSLA